MIASYERPEIRELGSLEELTLQTFNKVGRQPDTFSAITNGAVIGSIIASP